MSKFNQELANNFQLESDGTNLKVNDNVRGMKLLSFVTSIAVIHGADNAGKFDPNNPIYNSQLKSKILTIFGSDAEMEANFKKLKESPSDEQLAAYYDLVSNNCGTNAKATTPADLPALAELLAPKVETPAEAPESQTDAVPVAETQATEMTAEVNQTVAEAAAAVVNEVVVATEQIAPEVIEKIQEQIVAEAAETIQEQAAEKGVQISTQEASALARTALPIEALTAVIQSSDELGDTMATSAEAFFNQQAAFRKHQKSLNQMVLQLLQTQVQPAELV